MYTEEPRRRIDWPYVLRKVIIIVLIVLILFLIIWLINKATNNNKIKDNYNNNTTIKENKKNNTSDENNGGLSNPDYYSESFITNYMYFHDNARDFVEKNNLPIENNSVTYTLQELINKGIILPTSYGNNSCDTENSYVVVTNNNGKYTMTTTLICGKEIAKTNEELKCSGLCTNCNEEKEEECTDKDCNNTTTLEYEFKQSYKATDTVYSCPSGYIKTGTGANTKCVKNNNNVVSPTKSSTSTCPSGYIKTGTGTNTKCVKNGSEEIPAKKITTYNCDKYGKDYKLSGTSCIKSSTDTKPATSVTTYSCSNGQTPNSNHMCPTTSTTYSQSATATYSCSNGQTPNSNHMCPTTTTNYKCSDGDLVNTKYCRVYTTGSYYTSYTSYYGKTYNGCSYSGSSTTPCTNCVGSTRTVYNYKCYKTTYSDSPATPVSTTVYTTPATVSYSCTNGQTPNSNHMCPVTTTTYSQKATAKTTYNCSKYGSDYKLNGTDCVKSSTDTKNAIATYTYSCEKGILKDKTCIVDTGTQINPSINVSYICPTGYTKKGLATTAICTKGNVITVNPTKQTKEVTKYRTKWSTETSIPGWERTGRTRTVKAS